MLTLDDAPYPARSQDDIRAIHKARLPIAVQRARRSRFFEGRLDHIDLDRLDDPEEWRKIPIMTKDQLRGVPAERFYEDFCIAPREHVIEYWRSGGATGRPLFYPRSAEDMHYGMEPFRRLLRAAGCTSDDMVHVSFPMGIHPVGHLYARAAEQLGLATVWCGAGNNTPSELQLDLIRTLKPTVWAGMASYGLQLAQHATRIGFDLANSSVTRFLTAAEPVSPGKRERIERLWGATLFDQFGCTEGAAMGSESDAHDGMHFYTDLFYVEVVDETSREPVKPGETGLLVITPLWNNSVTPFLRWDTGDYVTWKGYDDAAGDLAVYPVIAHAARTAGFFKVRGININQADIEDFMHRVGAVTDFKIEAIETETLDGLRISVELVPGVNTETCVDALKIQVKNVFELTPEVAILEPGELEKEFAGQVKQNRFIDQRGAN
jgi:phenylacetate-CoA ligase